MSFINREPSERWQVHCFHWSDNGVEYYNHFLSTHLTIKTIDRTDMEAQFQFEESFHNYKQTSTLTFPKHSLFNVCCVFCICLLVVIVLCGPLLSWWKKLDSVSFVQTIILFKHQFISSIYRNTLYTEYGVFYTNHNFLSWILSREYPSSGIAII